MEKRIKKIELLPNPDEVCGAVFEVGTRFEKLTISKIIGGEEYIYLGDRSEKEWFQVFAVDNWTKEEVLFCKYNPMVVASIYYFTIGGKPEEA